MYAVEIAADAAITSAIAAIAFDVPFLADAASLL